MEEFSNLFNSLGIASFTSTQAVDVPLDSWGYVLFYSSLNGKLFRLIASL